MSENATTCSFKAFVIYKCSLGLQFFSSIYPTRSLGFQFVPQINITRFLGLQFIPSINTLRFPIYTIRSLGFHWINRGNDLQSEGTLGAWVKGIAFFCIMYVDEILYDSISQF